MKIKITGNDLLEIGTKESVSPLESFLIDCLLDIGKEERHV